MLVFTFLCQLQPIIVCLHFQKTVAFWLNQVRELGLLEDLALNECFAVLGWIFFGCVLPVFMSEFYVPSNFWLRTCDTDFWHFYVPKFSS